MLFTNLKVSRYLKVFTHTQHSNKHDSKIVNLSKLKIPQVLTFIAQNFNINSSFKKLMGFNFQYSLTISISFKFNYTKNNNNNKYH